MPQHSEIDRIVDLILEAVERDAKAILAQYPIPPNYEEMTTMEEARQRYLSSSPEDREALIRRAGPKAVLEMLGRENGNGRST